MHILFIHAILGCDTTSSVHGIGKGASHQMLSNPNSLEQANIFNKPMNDVSQEEVVVAGEKAPLYLYNTKETTLDKLRYSKFYRRIDTAYKATTSAAAREHNRRVFHQITVWKGEEVSPLDWGWKQVGDKYVPKFRKLLETMLFTRVYL